MRGARERATLCGVTVTVTIALAIAVIGLASGLRAAEPERPSDAELATWVREALLRDPRIDASAVEVATEAGVVTLSGHVPTLAGRKYAVVSTRRLLGVIAVVDRLEVRATPVEDGQLARDVKRRIVSSASVQATGLEVSARSGAVSLVGRVGSWAQYWQAELLASQVRGVREVDNTLQVEMSETRSDAAIQQDVESTLERDVYLTGTPIVVRVKRGEVSLSGTVASAFERERAANAARWIPNVRAVQNRLEVRWQAGRSDRIAAPLPRADSALADTILRAFRQDDRVDATDVSVVVDQGVATLSGRVTHAHQKRILEEDARNVVGIAWVSNRVEVVPPERRDPVVAMDIEEILAVDSALYELSLDAEVVDGVVTLRGEVPSRFHRNHAAAVVMRVLGVRGVVNQLEIVRKQASEDDALAAAIRRRLERDAITVRVATRIDVSVEAGVVTLSGDVDTLAQRNAAARVAARTPGVARVDNELSVDPYPYPWEDPPQTEPEESEPPGVPWEYFELDFPNMPWFA